MRNMWKCLFIAVAVVLIEWAWLGIAQYYFDGMSMECATIVGVGFFLAFLIIICTGIIVENIKKK